MNYQSIVIFGCLSFIFTKSHNISSSINNTNLINTTLHTSITLPRSRIYYAPKNVTIHIIDTTYSPIDFSNTTSKNNNSNNNNNNNNNDSTPENQTIICKEKRVFVNLRSNNSCYPPSAALSCFHDPLFCKKYFTSGKRNLQNERPTYGEYSSLKHEHWFHVIQHGGIAFLFNPCTAKKEVDNLRQVASQCLRRYVLAPYHKLTEEMPLALVSWGCFYMSTKVDELKMMTWIRKNAYSGPASHVHTNGKFKKNLVKKSKVLTDEKDAILCPNEEQLHSFKPTVIVSTTDKKTIVRDPESIINKRVIKLSKIKPGINISANISVTKIETGSAVWAAASLIFICGILVGWLLYTKVWSVSSENDYRYEPLGGTSGGSGRSFECEPGESQFNLLKSSQQFMSAFKWKGNCQKKEDPMTKMNLMVPINEDEEEQQVIYEK